MLFYPPAAAAPAVPATVFLGPQRLWANASFGSVASGWAPRSPVAVIVWMATWPSPGGPHPRGRRPLTTPTDFDRSDILPVIGPCADSGGASPKRSALVGTGSAIRSYRCTGSRLLDTYRMVIKRPTRGTPGAGRAPAGVSGTRPRSTRLRPKIDESFTLLGVPASATGPRTGPLDEENGALAIPPAAQR